MSKNLLTRNQMKSMNKDDLVSLAMNMQEAVTKLRAELFDPKNGHIPKLESQIAVQKKVNDSLSGQLQSVTRQSNMNAQYARKETVELHGFPANVRDNDIESKVVEIFNKILPDGEEKVSKSDFHTAHRMHAKDRVIVKFTHRKKMRSVLNYRSQLKETAVKTSIGVKEGEKIFLNE